MNNAASTVMTILFTFAAHATAGGNLLVNPGFEAGDFSGWTVGGNSIQTGVAIDGTPIPNVDPEFVPTRQRSTVHPTRTLPHRAAALSSV